MSKKNHLLATTLLVTIIFCLLSSFYSLAQTPPDWTWAKSAGGTGSETGYSVAYDAIGNILVTGAFHSRTLNFGTTTLTNANTSGFSSDIFIMKYDGGGNVLWAKSAGGTGNDYAKSVSTDTNGNVLITGSFASPTLTFGTTTLTNANTSINLSDIFIVKYDGDGNVLWAKSAGGGVDYDVRSNVVTVANGNVLVAGEFKSPTLTFGTTTLTNAGDRDIFLVKYDGSGNVLWAKSAGGTSNDRANSIATDANGNVLVTGEFQSPNLTFGTTTLQKAGYGDIFIVKYDGGGNVLWAKSAGGTDDDGANSVTTDVNGNVLVTGYFKSPSLTFGTTTMSNASYEDIFLVKYDGDGNVLWAKSAGRTSTDYAQSVATDANKNVLVIGSFSSPTITFGTTTLTNADPTSNSFDIFLVKYDVSGNVQWAKSTGGSGDENGISVVSNANGNVLVTGYFQSPTLPFGTITLTNAGSYDIFLAKLNGGSNSGINENKFINHINVYPNPAHKHLIIENISENSISAKKIIIENTIGQKVFQSPISQERFTLDLTGRLGKGIYFLYIYDAVDNLVTVRKIVMQ